MNHDNDIQEGPKLSDVERMELAERETDDSNESPPSDIIAYNELRSGADLLRMHLEGDLIIQPDFQRQVVWNSTDQTRFIDSLLKQLPIPSMCFAYDAKRNEWLVIDGLQRISTIVKFLNGDNWKLSRLPDVDDVLWGKTPSAFKAAKTGDMRKVFSRVQNQAIPVNVLRCDFSKKSHNEYLFTIFHRLNSGGLKLNNQEIRNCIYSGSFNNLLKRLDENANWRAINNMRPGEHYRFAKQEAILRFFAFFYGKDKYRGSISKFLNDYMSDRRNAPDDVLAAHEEVFSRVVAAIAAKMIVERPAPRMPGTVIEAIMIGVGSNLAHVDAMPSPAAKELFDNFRVHPSISDVELAEGLSKKDKVDARLNAAIQIFAG